MMKKRIFCLCLVLVMTLCMTTQISAAKTSEITPFGYGAEYATPENGIVLGPRVDEMSPAEQRAAGLVAPFSGRQSKAYVNKLAIIVGGDHTVYANTDKRVSKGYVSSRERVYVYNNNTNSLFYYIQFMNDGELDFGYVNRDAVKVPSKSWAAPITSGYISQDYVGKHTGIDVSDSLGTSIYAVSKVPHTSKISTATVEGLTQLVNYGNHITCRADGQNVVYAHLSSFAYGEADTTTPSYRHEFKEYGKVDTEPIETYTPGKGEEIGGLGNSGWTEGRTGLHLHFETRGSDPFASVVFPDIGY